MPFDVRYDPEHDCIISRYSGDLDMKSFREYAAEMAKTASKHDCKCLINDMREAEIKWSTVDLYNLPNLLDSEGITRSWKRAILFTEISENARFFETAARNKGYRVKIFTDRDEAMGWLRKK
jgi:hypothetical protein